MFIFCLNQFENNKEKDFLVSVFVFSIYDDMYSIINK